MFTPARICTGLSAVCTGLLGTFAAQMPLAARITLTGVGLFLTAILAASGPVQASSTDKVTVKPDPGKVQP